MGAIVIRTRFDEVKRTHPRFADWQFLCNLHLYFYLKMYLQHIFEVNHSMLDILFGLETNPTRISS